MRRWAARITAICHARTGRADVAEDLSPEVLYRGFKALPTLTEPQKFGPWLCGIAVRTCLDWLKSKSRSEVSVAALDQGNIPAAHCDHAGDLETQDELKRLVEEVEKLPERYREVVMLYYYSEVTYRDLAAQLGVSTATINARLTQARALLRERLCRSGGKHGL